jgi:hypothetical protein
MRHIKPYQIFEASAAAPEELTAEQIDWLNECTSGSWELNTSTGLVDVKGNFNCNSQNLEDLKGVKFGTVGGVFACDKNQITSLEGAPQESRWGSSLDFSCSDNPVSEKTLKAIFKLMLKGMRYQQALEEYWPKMGDEDRAVMWKQIPDLPLEDARKYKALATYAKIKGYL